MHLVPITGLNHVWQHSAAAVLQPVAGNTNKKSLPQTSNVAVTIWNVHYSRGPKLNRAQPEKTVAAADTLKAKRDTAMMQSHWDNCVVPKLRLWSQTECQQPTVRELPEQLLWFSSAVLTCAWQPQLRDSHFHVVTAIPGFSYSIYVLWDCWSG